MTTDKTKQRIQELVPEVMELKFGCEVRDRDGEAVLIRSYKKVGDLYEGKNERGITVFTQFEEILGSPITLAVVLRAIAISGNFFSGYMRPARAYWFEAGDGEKTEMWQFWNLAKDNYDDQTQETKDFIGKLLGV